MTDRLAPRQRGRPPKLPGAAAQEATYILEVCIALRLKRFAKLAELGFTEAAALRFLMKRRRGLIGEYVNRSIDELLGSSENRTHRALQLITEHGVKVSVAALAMAIDKRSLQRLLPAARDIAKQNAARQAEFASNTEISCISALLESATTTPAIYPP